MDAVDRDVAPIDGGIPAPQATYELLDAPETCGRYSQLAFGSELDRKFYL
jgi:hypothetical protein